MKFLYALQCHNFQRRLCWVLSSIVQQSCFPFDIIIDIACQRYNGDPLTETIANSFNNIGLQVNLTYIDDREIFAKRGLIRNIQIKNAIQHNREYIWFADADHVYHPQMFEKLIRWIIKNKTDEPICIFSRIKTHTTIESINKLIDNSLNELPYIDNAFIRVAGLPIIEHIDKSLLAPGNMQVCAVKDIIEQCNSQYIDPDNCNDRHLFKEYQKAWSDRVFRVKLGRSQAVRLPLQIHMNHIRDKDFKNHIETQR